MPLLHATHCTPQTQGWFGSPITRRTPTRWERGWDPYPPSGCTSHRPIARIAIPIGQPSSQRDVLPCGPKSFRSKDCSAHQAHSTHRIPAVYIHTITPSPPHPYAPTARHTHGTPHTQGSAHRSREEHLPGGNADGTPILHQAAIRTGPYHTFRSTNQRKDSAHRSREEHLPGGNADGTRTLHQAALSTGP